MSHQATGHKIIYRRGEVYYFRVKNEFGRWVERRYGTNLEDAVLAQARSQTDADAIRHGLTTREKLESAKHRGKTYDEALSEYIRHLEAKRNSSGHVQQAKSRCQFMATALKFRTLDDVQAGAVQIFLDTVSESGKSVRCRNDYLVKVHAFMQWCVRPMRYIPTNPLTGLSVLSAATDPRRPVRALTPDEFSGLLAAAKRERPLAYWLAGGIGLRWSEIRKLDWSQVDLVRGWMTLPSSISKNKKETCLPVPEPVLRALRVVKNKTGPVCSHPPILRTFKEDCKRAGIAIKSPTGNVHRRSLRKTFITHLAIGGVDLRIAQRLARHSRPELTANIYTDANLLDMRDAMRRIAKVQSGKGVAKSDSGNYNLRNSNTLREAI